MKNFLNGFLFYFISAYFICLSNSCTKSSPKQEDQPVITSILPNAAKGGAVVTVYGKHLLKFQGNIAVSINNKIAPVTLSTDDSIKVLVPPKAGSGEVVLIAGNKKYNGPEFTYEYEAIVTTIAGSGAVGSADGPGPGASFNCPWGITVDKNGDLYIADSYGRLIRKIDTSTNIVSSINIPVLIKDSLFYSPYNITIDTISGSLYVTDFNEHLLKIGSDADMTVIFTDSMPLAGVGVGPDKKLYLTNNKTGEIIQVDTTGQNRKVFSTGLVTPRNIVFDKDYNMFVAGLGIYKVANTGSWVQLINPPDSLHGWEIAVDTLGNFYEADHFNNLIRKIDPSGNITVIAGNGNAADADGIGLNASFDGPTGMAIDKDGNLYVSTYNFTTATGNKIRKISFR